MTHKTKKAGVAGKWGARYGVKTRKAVATVLEVKNATYECPQCKHVTVRRVSRGIWKCRRCDLTFAGGAYTPGVLVAGAPTEAALIEAARGKPAEDAAPEKPTAKEED